MLNREQIRKTVGTWENRAILEGNKNPHVLQVIRNPELLADRSATLHKRELK